MKNPNPIDLKRPQARSLRITIAVIVLTIFGSMFFGWLRWKRFDAEWKKIGPVEATGGIYQQPRLELKVPIFRQSDPKWGQDKLGTTPASLAAEGCAVASAAMVLAAYGIDTDPGRLNKYLTENAGYVGTGWIVWEKAAEISGGKFEKAYEDPPSFWLIDNNLRAGNPVIAKLRAKDGTNHFVVICGKDGYDYLTSDPGTAEGRGVYPLKEYGSKIEGIRFYRRVLK
jgi:hypothetical protein